MNLYIAPLALLGAGRPMKILHPNDEPFRVGCNECVTDGRGTTVVLDRTGPYTYLELMVRITNMREGNL